MSLTARLRRLRAPLLLLALSPPAAAWDAETHLVILDAARRISPALDARLAVHLQDALEEGVRQADLMDPKCVYHRGPDARPEAWDRVARVLDEIRSGKRTKTPKMHARAMGELAHYAADCLVPKALIVSKISQSVSLAAYDVAVFRDPKPLLPSLVAALTARAEEGAWADDCVEANVYLFREAVNAVVDVLLSAPVPPGVEEKPDAGPVLFFVNNIDVMPERMKHNVSPLDQEDPDQLRFAKAVRAALPSIETLPYARPSLARRDVHVMEWVPRRMRDHTEIKALLFNAQSTCARRVVLRASGWIGSVTVSLPAWSFKWVKLNGPPVSPDDVEAYASCGPCEVDETSSPSFPARHALVYPMGEHGLPETRVRPQDVTVQPSAKFAGHHDIQYDLTLDEAVGALRILALSVRREPESWNFIMEAEATDQVRAAPMILEVEAVAAAGVKATYPIRFDLRGFGPGTVKRMEVTVPEKTARFRSPRFRVASIQREGGPNQPIEIIGMPPTPEPTPEAGPLRLPRSSYRPPPTRTPRTPRPPPSSRPPLPTHIPRAWPPPTPPAG